MAKDIDYEAAVAKAPNKEDAIAVVPTDPIAQVGAPTGTKDFDT